jgi:hypothetical protein
MIYQLIIFTIQDSGAALEKEFFDQQLFSFQSIEKKIDDRFFGYLRKLYDYYLLPDYRSCQEA